LVLGTVLGLITGSLLALFNSFRRGVYYTRSSIVAEAQASINLKSKVFSKLSRLPMTGLLEKISRQKNFDVDEAEIFLSGKKVVLIVNAGGKAKHQGIACVLATKSSLSGNKVLIFDTMDLLNDIIDSKNKTDEPNISKAHEGIDIWKQSTENNSVSPINTKKFKNDIKKLIPLYDQVYFYSNDKEASSILMSLKHFDPHVVIITRVRKTKKLFLRKLRSIYNIGLVLND